MFCIVLFLFTHVHKYISVLLDSLSLLQSNLTRKIKANIQAVLSHGIPLISQTRHGSARAATAYFDCLLQKSSSSSSSSSSNTDGSSRRLAKNYNHNLKKNEKFLPWFGKKLFSARGSAFCVLFERDFRGRDSPLNRLKLVIFLLFVFSLYTVLFVL